jgi:hypothetical protein
MEALYDSDGLEPNYWQLFEGEEGIVSWIQNQEKAVNLRIVLENKLAPLFDVEIINNTEIVLYDLDHAVGAVPHAKLWFTHETIHLEEGDDNLYQYHIAADTEDTLNSILGKLQEWDVDVQAYDEQHGQIGGRQRRRPRKTRRSKKNKRKTKKRRT